MPGRQVGPAAAAARAPAGTRRRWPHCGPDRPVRLAFRPGPAVSTLDFARVVSSPAAPSGCQRDAAAAGQAAGSRGGSSPAPCAGAARPMRVGTGRLGWEAHRAGPPD